MKRFCSAFLSLFFPVRCEACGVALAAENAAGLCDICQSQVRWLKPPFCSGCGRSSFYGQTRCAHCRWQSPAYDAAYACAAYDGHMKTLLHRYKFGRRRSLKNYLAAILAAFAARYLAQRRFDAVVAVPLDAAKIKKRGFNQSQLLSQRLAATLGIPDKSSSLKRLKSASDQARLSKRQRRMNIRGCFYASQRATFADARVLLVDDVLTTGHTASDCARALKEAGAESVTVLACARGDA